MSFFAASVISLIPSVGPSHDACSAYVFNLFIPVIMLKMLRFKLSALFGRHTLLDRSLSVLQLQTHLSKLTTKWIVT